MGGAPLAPERLRQVAEDVRDAFPRPSEGHELVLIDVDPHHLHAFWTVSPAAVAAARETLAGTGDTAPLVLRVHEWSEDHAGAAFDVEVVGLQGQSYIDVWSEARGYRATLGLRADSGRLVPLVTSVPVALPALSPAQAPAKAPAQDARTPVASSAAAEKTAGQPAEPVRHPFPLPPAEAGEYDPGLLSDDQPPQDTTAAAAEHPIRKTGNGALKTASATAVDGAAKASLPPGIGDALPEPVHYDFPLPPMEAGEYVPELIGGFLPPDTPSPKPAAGEPAQDTTADQLPAEGGAEGGEAAPPPDEGEPLPLPLENVLSLSSFALGREQVEFEINAELHIFGRAKAGTQLHLFGRKVTLRPDGTFSISRPLPNGALVLSSLLVNGSDDGPSD